jgi:hypothetical protein
MKAISRRVAVGLTATVATLTIGTAAIAATITAVDPSTVPTGFLVAGDDVETPLDLKVGQSRERILPDGSEVYVQHASIPAGGSTGWHTHAGPVIVMMVGGALTLYDGDDKTCTGTRYASGTGFIDQGYGHVHIARNEGSTPAEFYATYILPAGSGPAGVKVLTPDQANPNCPF